MIGPLRFFSDTSPMIMRPSISSVNTDMSQVFFAACQSAAPTGYCTLMNPAHADLADALTVLLSCLRREVQRGLLSIVLLRTLSSRVTPGSRAQL